MPWTRENGAVTCESAKHDRYIEILLRSVGARRKRHACWRQRGDLAKHVFKAEKPLSASRPGRAD